ncbi:hypothetical protein CCH79_00003438 [Gambusia affinis]|uniref:Uncharacterized protein n=1 Tax=Gambusia affinis TaxID=33528 RepID=A0A315VF67_GAMAF|nr:hypothetical protein CCH79_00003438 [Gambusia affinis]
MKAIFGREIWPGLKAAGYRKQKPCGFSGEVRSFLSEPQRHLPGVMTQQMQNLQLSQTRKCPGGPTSPSAAKRLYRNLSEKLRGSTSSFEDAYFFGKTDRLRKASFSGMLNLFLRRFDKVDVGGEPWKAAGPLGSQADGSITVSFAASLILLTVMSAACQLCDASFIMSFPSPYETFGHLDSSSEDGSRCSAHASVCVGVESLPEFSASLLTFTDQPQQQT